MANKCVIMRGCSGSGKSTYIKNHFPNAIVVSADDFWLDDDGNYNFDAKRLGEAHAWALRRFVSEIQIANDFPTERPIVVDNTNTTIGELAPYYSIANAYGFDTEIITLDVDPRKAAARNVHRVPDATVDRQYVNCFTNTAAIPKWWNHKIVRQNEDGYCP